MKDPVYDEVLARDARATMRMLADKGVPLNEMHQWFWTRPVCVAPLVDPSQSGTCWGRSTFDHIKSQPRMSRRATSDRRHLVTVCQGHMEDGMRAGYQLNTAHRPELREYIEAQEGV